MSDAPATRSARLRPIAALGLGASLAGCASVSDAVREPQLSPISNPAVLAGAERVSMPSPAPVNDPAGPNSLWRAGARSFFGDQRAAQIGDLLTVNIEISDRANVANSTQRSRTGDQEMNIEALLGFEEKLTDVLPGTPSLDPAIGFGSSSSSNGTGAITRAESINLTVAAVIVDKLPNGNLVIGGSQEVKVNSEVRQLLVSGVIRPQDIAADNTIDHTKIAAARIAYGGRGDLSTVQRPRYGDRLFEQVAPF
jgi:flagellar L-ring protein FlgH